MTMGRTVGCYTGALVLYFLFTGCLDPVLAQDLAIVNVTATGELGRNANVTCTVMPENAQIEWLFQGSPLNDTGRITITTKNGTLPAPEPGAGPRHVKMSTVTITNTTRNDADNFTCVVKLGEDRKIRDEFLNLSFSGKLVNHTESPHSENATGRANVNLECEFEVYKPTTVKWYKVAEDENINLFNDTQLVQISPKRVKSNYNFNISGNEDDGKYICEMEDIVNSTNMTGEIDVHVYDIPEIIIDQLIAINTTQIYLNWTVKTHHSPIQNYQLLLNNMNQNEYRYHRTKIDNNATSFVIDGLENNTKYRVKLHVSTKYGNSKPFESGVVETLDSEPVFVPNISINGFSATSVTIGWESPPAKITPLIHYYILEARKKDENVTRTAYHSRNDRNLPYMFDSLEPHSTYVFKVRACSDFTKACGNWSAEMEAATLDGIPDEPSDVNVNCSTSFLTLAWKPPKRPKAEIKGYILEIVGEANFRDGHGKQNHATWGPLSKFMTNDSTSISGAADEYSMRVNDLQPNTNYTVRISAMTRTRRRGVEKLDGCQTSYSAPDAPPRPKWRKIHDSGKYMFKMFLPRISERNGPVCCYRVYMVRMPPHASLATLPLANQIQVTDYASAHGTDATVRAYITDVFSNDYFPADSELVMGDEVSRYNRSGDPALRTKDCSRCLRRPNRMRPEPPPAPHHPPDPPQPPLTTTEQPEDEEAIEGTEDPEDLVTAPPTRRRRFYANSNGDTNDYSSSPTMMNAHGQPKEEEKDLEVHDGTLDSNYNYTLFVELIPGLPDEEPLYSDYTSVLMPAPSPPVTVPASAVEIALQATCAVAALVLLLMIVFCVMQSRRSRKLPHHAHLEMNSLPTIIRTVLSGFCGRQQLVTLVPPDKPPIAKEDLAEAYSQRQLDSDYGFQKEFELLQMLPEYFPDRTTHASEARENQPKNRYPDIKAYDQTRVKLAQIDGITGSDYINANYVMGYQERKKFICAQGPTDTTVNDFWRMIWEHGLELIVMLTNLEEYSKVKCSKYWPEERGSRAFGSITVHHVGEKRYSDYIVREMKITKQHVNSEGQPIVENNGVSKRNGDCKDPESSAPTSPREIKEETRLVRQYHFLMWKDFAAPEQPHTILKFIKRVNEAWSSMVGRPIVVHCSAGVGRTGTLVALDCLTQQLQATGQVTIFNTIAELRSQRNFLVQSLKQYVFVYRALVEYAHFGDTEISAGRLKPAVDRLRNTPEGADKCLMEEEFEKIVSCPVSEPLRSCAAGAGEELRARNRSPDCLPYDRNRVILTPLPGRDYSTYINASFIEAYDSTEGFIITQDPLPNTVMDFWRMVSEHNVTTIVMLSEMGDGKCPRYWDDDTIQYEHISVQYEESESCPYYTRRQFIVTNDKTGELSNVRQLQYQGWPTAPGHVPEVTRGLAELADAAAPNQDIQGTMLVHCQYGTERSPLFVALCTLIRQLRTERRVDVSAVARAVRHQRAKTIDTFLQYEFLYRAILNYAELHNLLEDS